MMIITNDLIKRALEMARPMADHILFTEGMTWGPKWVEGYLQAPGIGGPIPFKFGQITEWNEIWGPKGKSNFSDIALKKLELADSTGQNTSVVIVVSPWILQDGEYLYAGGASRQGISVGVSGAKGWVDEAISNIVIECIILLAHLETDARIASGNKRIGDKQV
jgi:hypothetical protein